MPPIAGGLVAFGWNAPFLLYGLSFVVIIFVYIYVPETARGMDADSTIGAELQQYARSMRSEVDRDLFIITTGGFIRFFILFGVLTFMPLFAARELNATPVIIGILLSTKAIRIVISPATGLLVSIISRQWAIAVSLGLLAASTLAMPFSPSVIWLGAFMLLNTVGDAFFSPLVDDTVTSFVRDENRSGTVSILRVFKEAGKTLAPVGLGVVLALLNFEAVFIVTAVLAALYIIPILLFIDPPEKRLSEMEAM
jgi:MFS family permease